MESKSNKILIWCHGGCFGGGHASYDEGLRDYVTSQGWTVNSVEFATDNYTQALLDISEEVIKADYKTNQVVLGGISSGGFLAHQIANKFHLPALLICPVLAPAARHYNLEPEMQIKQLTFFKTLDGVHKAQSEVQKPNCARYIIYGTQDTRAPRAPYEPWKPLPHVTLEGQVGGHELCKNPPLDKVMVGLAELLK